MDGVLLWPARIVADQAEGGESIQKSRKPNTVLVKSFGDFAYVWVPMARLRHFTGADKVLPQATPRVRLAILEAIAALPAKQRKNHHLPATATASIAAPGSPSTPPASSGWTCADCTSTNHSRTPTCGVCQSPRREGAWTCTVCTLQNAANTRKCKACQSACAPTEALAAAASSKRVRALLDQHQASEKAARCAKQAILWQGATAHAASCDRGPSSVAPACLTTDGSGHDDEPNADEEESGAPAAASFTSCEKADPEQADTMRPLRGAEFGCGSARLAKAAMRRGFEMITLDRDVEAPEYDAELPRGSPSHWVAELKAEISPDLP